MSATEDNVASPQVEAVPAGDAASGAEAGTEGVWPVDRLRPMLEAVLFAAGDPLPVKKITDILEGPTQDEVKAALRELSVEFLTRGVRLVEVAGGWQMRTAPEHQRYVRKLFRERPQKLSRAATETLAIIAYRQPVTRSEIEAVRGVESGGVLELLLERNLAKVVGRKEVPGRPLVYATTQEFLELFGLAGIRDLPTLPELGSDFERMSQQGGFHETTAGEIVPLEDGDGGQEEAGAREAFDEGSDAGVEVDPAGIEGDPEGVEGIPAPEGYDRTGD